MCGIYGYLSQNEKIQYEKSLFRELSSSAEIRGQEACGFSLVSNDLLKIKNLLLNPRLLTKVLKLKICLISFMRLKIQNY